MAPGGKQVPMPTRVFVVDDHKLLRELLRTLLEAQPDYEVVGEAENGLEALQLIPKAAPDLVLMDIMMPEMNGIEAARQILAAQPHIRILALSMCTDKRLVSEAFRAGVSGYLFKDCSTEEILRALRAIAKGQAYLSPAIAGVVMADYVAGLSNDGSAWTLLTSREREVLQLLAEGKRNKEIAALLGISEKTVETHRQHVQEKLGCESLADLIKYAIREGLTSLDR